ncbi:MAG TPA: hypothetical protein VF275_03915 [Gammaproteobacteria bacterium]
MKIAKGLALATAWIVAAAPVLLLVYAFAISCQGWGCSGVGAIVSLAVLLSVVASVALIAVAIAMHLHGSRWKSVVPMFVVSMSPFAFVVLTEFFR